MLNRDLKIENIIPLCPFCEQEIKNLIVVKEDRFVERIRVYCCPHCHKIVGICDI